MFQVLFDRLVILVELHYKWLVYLTNNTNVHEFERAFDLGRLLFVLIGVIRG